MDCGSYHARMFIRPSIFNAVILSVFVAEIAHAAVRLAGG